MHPQSSRRRAISTTIDRGYPPVLTPRQASGPLQETVVVPGSKSITNRALLVAALAEGESVLTGALESDDTLYMAGALNALGVKVLHDAEAANTDRNTAGSRRLTMARRIQPMTPVSGRAATIAAVRAPWR